MPPIDAPNTCADSTFAASSTAIASSAMSAMVNGPGDAPLSPTPRLSKRIVLNRDARIGVNRCHHTWVAPSPMMRRRGSPEPCSVQKKRTPSRSVYGISARPVVFGVSGLLQPLRLAAETDVDLNQALGRRRSVPVHDVRSGVVALAGAELLHRLPFLLRAHPSLLDKEQLAFVVAVPRRARARLEAPAAGADVFRVHRVALPGDARIVLLRVPRPVARSGQRARESNDDGQTFHGLSLPAFPAPDFPAVLPT